MKMFSFPLASLEKAIQKRMLTQPSPHRKWFSVRWAQKSCKNTFVKAKAMPLVTPVARGKTLDAAAFAELLQDRDMTLCDAKEVVLRPLIQCDGPLVPTQKNLPLERAEALLSYQTQGRSATDANQPSPAAEPTVD